MAKCIVGLGTTQPVSRHAGSARPKRAALSANQAKRMRQFRRVPPDLLRRSPPQRLAVVPERARPPLTHWSRKRSAPPYDEPPKRLRSKGSKAMSGLHAGVILRIALGFADLARVDVSPPDLVTLKPDSVAYGSGVAGTPALLGSISRCPPTAFFLMTAHLLPATPLKCSLITAHRRVSNLKEIFRRCSGEAPGNPVEDAPFRHNRKCRQLATNLFLPVGDQRPANTVSVADSRSLLCRPVPVE